MDQTDYTPSRPCSTPHLTQHVVTVARSDRWQAHYRLQELGIACTCSENGQLQVEVNGPIAVAQLWSVLQQLTRSRKQLSSWLEQCWNLPTAYEDSY